MKRSVHTVTLNSKTAIIPLNKGGVLTTETEYNPKTKADAYDMYLNRALSLEDISVLLSVDRNVIARWSKKEKWLERKKQIEDELMKSVELKFRTWELEHKYKVAEKQLEQATAMQEVIQKTLEQLDKASKGNAQAISNMPGKLKQLADALQACANIGARTVGLGAPSIAAQQAAAKASGGNSKQPLVIINTTPVLSAQQSGEGSSNEEGGFIDVNPAQESE